MGTQRVAETEVGYTILVLRDLLPVLIVAQPLESQRPLIQTQHEGVQRRHSDTGTAGR